MTHVLLGPNMRHSAIENLVLEIFLDSPQLPLLSPLHGSCSHSFLIILLCLGFLKGAHLLSCTAFCLHRNHKTQIRLFKSFTRLQELLKQIWARFHANPNTFYGFVSTWHFDFEIFWASQTLRLYVKPKGRELTWTKMEKIFRWTHWKLKLRSHNCA